MAVQEGKSRIPPPSEDKPPLHANAFFAMRNINSALAPMFPYASDGDMVAAATIFYGGEGRDGKAFHHENTVDEVSIVFAAEKSQMRPGFVHVGARKHMVGNYFDDPTDPDILTAIVVVQRQSDPGVEQWEALTFFCESCQEPLLHHRYSAKVEDQKNADLPGYAPPLETLTEGAICLEPYNASDEARTCPKCGAKNEPWPVSVWGWDHYHNNFVASERARRQLIEGGN